MTSEARLRILVLLPFAPDHDGFHGGARSTAEIVAMLARHHDVHVLYLEPPGASRPRRMPEGCASIEAVALDAVPPPSKLRRAAAVFGRLVFLPPAWVGEARSAAMAQRAAELARQLVPDIVQFEYHVMAQYLPVIRAACPSARLIVGEQEPGVLADEREGGSPTLRQRVGALARRSAWRRFERQTLVEADALVVFTERDKATLLNLLGAASPPIAVIPLRLAGGPEPMAAVGSSVACDLVFTGNFAHPPNVDAARRLIFGILPLIHQHKSDVRLAIVGANPPADLLECQGPRIEVTGWVDDPAVYVRGAKAVLAPLRQGGGLRVKMLDACRAGKAIVASEVAVEGLGLRDRQDVLLAETDAQFAQCARAILDDSDLRERLERASRSWFEREQDPDRWAEQYARLYRSLLVRTEVAA